MVNGIILKPLPYSQPESLVGAWLVAPGAMPGPLNQSAATYLMLRDSAQSFQDIGLRDNGSATITGHDDPEQVQTLSVTDGTLGVLGVQAAMGRGFRSSPSAISQTLIINGTAREVIGVLPERFRLLDQHAAVVIPFKFNRAEPNALGFSYPAIARLKPGVSIAPANADVERLLPSLAARFPLPAGFTRKMFDGD